AEWWLLLLAVGLLQRCPQGLHLGFELGHAAGLAVEPDALGAEQAGEPHVRVRRAPAAGEDVVLADPELPQATEGAAGGLRSLDPGVQVDLGAVDPGDLLLLRHD